jgi:tryptophan synthase alpha subunit
MSIDLRKRMSMPDLRVEEREDVKSLIQNFVNYTLICVKKKEKEKKKEFIKTSKVFIYAYFVTTPNACVV